MTEGWFWGTPEWARYLEAYGRPNDPHYGVEGNLVIALGPDVEMWRRIRKGHQAAIRKAERSYRIADDFEMYRGLHRLANGLVRSEATFDCMRSWVGSHGMVWVAMDGPVAAAAAYFITYQDGTYYASGPRNPRHGLFPGAAHLLIWHAMKQLADAGYVYMDMGPVPGPEATDKEQSIAAFKSHFGATVKKWQEGYA